MSHTSDEIASQPHVWRRALSLAVQIGNVIARPGERVAVIGCGTSAYVAQSIAYLRERAGLGETDAWYASEPRPARRYDAIIAVTRSGTTTEVLSALQSAPTGVRRVVITGVADSPCAALADDLVLLDFADEESVVQTRFPTTLLLLARAAFGEDVSELPDRCAAALGEAERPLPDGLDHFVFLGSGWTYGLAQEAALKIREAAQAWAESYPLLDYRHGPLAVAHTGTLVWMLGCRDDALAREIRESGAVVLAEVADDPLIELTLAQRLAVRVAESRGLDPDAPRRLTRSIILAAHSADS